MLHLIHLLSVLPALVSSQGPAEVGPAGLSELSAASRACIACHRKDQPALYQQWGSMASGEAVKVAAAGKLRAKIDEVLSSDDHKWYLDKMDPAEAARRAKAAEDFKRRYQKQGLSRGPVSGSEECRGARRAPTDRPRRSPACRTSSSPSARA